MPASVLLRVSSTILLSFHEDSHEPRLKVKDENIGTNSTGSYLTTAGSQSRSQSGGQSPDPDWHNPCRNWSPREWTKLLSRGRRDSIDALVRVEGKCDSGSRCYHFGNMLGDAAEVGR